VRELYSVSFPVQLYDTGTVMPIKGAYAGYAQAQAIQELHRCFNCSCPVSGGSARYPSAGLHATRSRAHGRLIGGRTCQCASRCRGTCASRRFSPDD
jgi:hypothetical protein